jgi:hypothetical protein
LFDIGRLALGAVRPDPNSLRWPASGASRRAIAFPTKIAKAVEPIRYAPSIRSTSIADNVTFNASLAVGFECVAGFWHGIPLRLPDLPQSKPIDEKSQGERAEDLKRDSRTSCARSSTAGKLNAAV